MTGRERTLAALDRRQPDCVPTFVHAILEPAVIAIGRYFMDGLPEPGPAQQMCPEDQVKLAEAYARIHEELDIDSLVVGMMGTEEVVDEGHYRDEWGVVRAWSSHGAPVPVGYPIATEADLDAYTPPPATEPQCLLMARAVQLRDPAARARLYSMPGPFTQSWSLRGMERLLFDYVRNPDLVHRLARMATDHALDEIDIVAEDGMDGVIIAEDVADKNNPLMSPSHFDTFVGPYCRELLDRARAHGLRVIFHSDGNMWPLLDRVVALGVDAINPLEPSGGMDLARVKVAYGDRLCLVGNLDCGALLSYGTPDDVEAEVQRAIAAAAPGGGYILADSNAIHPGVRPENFMAMMRAAKRFGVYA